MPKSALRDIPRSIRERAQIKPWGFLTKVPTSLNWWKSSLFNKCCLGQLYIYKKKKKKEFWPVTVWIMAPPPKSCWNLNPECSNTNWRFREAIGFMRAEWSLEKGLAGWEAACLPISAFHQVGTHVLSVWSVPQQGTILEVADLTRHLPCQHLDQDFPSSPTAYNTFLFFVHCPVLGFLL